MKSELVYLQHIAAAFERIIRYVDGLSREEFWRDERTQDACIRQLEIVGEATKRLPKSFREEHPEIPWKAMAGMRDRLIHDYLNVDLEVVWVAATEEAVEMLIELNPLLEDLEEQ